jgi:hypothetical protein
MHSTLLQPELVVVEVVDIHEHPQRLEGSVVTVNTGPGTRKFQASAAEAMLVPCRRHQLPACHHVQVVTQQERLKCGMKVVLAVCVLAGGIAAGIGHA